MSALRSFVIAALWSIAMPAFASDEPSFELTWVVAYNASTTTPRTSGSVDFGPPERHCTLQINGYDKPSVARCPARGKDPEIRRELTCPKGASRSWDVTGFPDPGMKVFCRSAIRARLPSVPGSGRVLSDQDIVTRFYGPRSLDPYYREPTDVPAHFLHQVAYFTDDKAEALTAALAVARTMYRRDIVTAKAQRETEKDFLFAIGDTFWYRVEKLGYFTWSQGLTDPIVTRCRQADVPFEALGVLELRPLTERVARELSSYHRKQVDGAQDTDRDKLIDVTAETARNGDWITRFVLATARTTTDQGNDAIDALETTYVVDKRTGVVWIGCKKLASQLAGHPRPVD